MEQGGNLAEQVANVLRSSRDLTVFAETEQAGALVTQILRCWPYSRIQLVLGGAGYDVFPLSQFNRQANPVQVEGEVGSPVSERAGTVNEVSQAGLFGEDVNQSPEIEASGDLGPAVTRQGPRQRAGERPASSPRTHSELAGSNMEGNSEVGIDDNIRHDDGADGQEGDGENEQVSGQPMPNTRGRNSSSAEGQRLPSDEPMLAQASTHKTQSIQKRRAEGELRIEGSHKRRDLVTHRRNTTTPLSDSDSESHSPEEERNGPSLPDDGFVLICEVTNYRAVQDQLFAGKHRKEQDRAKVQELFKFYTNPKTMAQALRLLGLICSTNSTAVQLGWVAVGESDAATSQPPQDALTLAKRAGIWANTVLEKTSELADQITLREIMATITLHLIYEKFIVPMWEQRSPQTQTLADGVKESKWDFYYNTLGGQKAMGVRLKTFKERVGYGNTLFTMAQSLGAPALLMVAASGCGVTAFARKLRKWSQVTRDLTAALSTSPLWWCFTHAIGHLTVARLFSTTWPSVNSSQLAYWMRSQPLPAASLKRWEAACRELNITLESSLPPDHLRLVPGENYPTVTLHWLHHTLRVSPMIQSVTIQPANEYEDLGTWLRNLDEGDMVEVGTNNKFRAQVLQDLLPGRAITSALMDLFCNIHNAKCLNGFFALDSNLGRVLLNQAIPHSGLQSLRDVIGDAVWDKDCREILTAIEGVNGILGCQISVAERSALLYNWMPGQLGKDLDTEGYEVVRGCLPATGWSIDRAPVHDSEVVATKRESALSFLHLSRSLITGTRCQLYTPELDRPATVQDITCGLVVDGFALAPGNGWRVCPAYWFGLAGRDT